MRTFWLALLALLIATPALAESHSGEGEDDSTETGDGEDGEGDDSGESAPEETGAESEGSDGPEEVVEESSEAGEAKDANSDNAADNKADELKAAKGEGEADRADDSDGLSPMPAPPLVLDLGNGVTLRPIARVQARVTVFDEDDPDRNDPILYGDPGLREGLSLRRVRLGVDGDWKGLLGVRVVGGFDNRYDYTEPFGHSPSLTEATFRLTPFDELGVAVGLARVPFGRQATTSSASLALWERSIAAEHMSPDREVGAYLSGSFGPEENPALGSNAFRWAFGVSNGGGDWTGDADPSPRMAGRVSLDIGAPWEQVESGFSLAGFGLSVGGSLAHNWGLEADSLSAGADLGVRVGRLGLQGEFMISNAVPTFDTEGIPEQLAERTSMGGYGQLLFVILDGSLEAAFRVGGYDDNTGLSDAGDRLDIAGGVNFFLFEGRLKAQLNFVHRMELTESHSTGNDSLILQVQARL